MSELVMIGLKVSPELRDRLRSAAEVSGRSVSAILLEGASVMLTRLDGGVAPPIMPEVEANETLPAGVIEFRHPDTGEHLASIVNVGKPAAKPKPKGRPTSAVSNQQLAGNAKVADLTTPLVKWEDRHKLWKGKSQ